MGDLRNRAETAGNGVAAAEPQWEPPTPEENGLAVADALAESPVPAEMDVPVHVAWSRVMGDVQWLGKGRQARDYKYRGIDDVMDLVAPVVRKHGVMVIPVGAVPTYEIIHTSKGAAMNYCRIVSRFEVFGPRGDSFIGETPGEAFDNGDKSSTKAQSVALRTFYIQALALATNRPQLDTEYGEQHEIAGPRKPTPGEYMAEILNPQTPMHRLSMIMSELDSDRATGGASVELADGEKIRLVDLVRQVGRERKDASR
jgi:hypothetical protein